MLSFATFGGGFFARPLGGTVFSHVGDRLSLDFSFNGPEPTDTQFDTVEINRQYEGVSDFRCIRSMSSPC